MLKQWPVPISRIYLDTSILVAHSWPVPSPTLTSLLDIARLAPIPIFIPELVASECEYVWRRRFEELKRKAIGNLDALATFTDAFTKPRIAFPSSDDAIARYRDLVVGLMRPPVFASPLTRRPASELLLMSVAHQSPFPDSDSSFRDATIMVSVTDHLAEAAEAGRAVLLTKDGFFQGATLGSGWVVEASADIGAAVDDIQGEIAERLKRRLIDEWLADRAAAKTALDGDRDRIKRFIEENLQVPAGGGWLLGPKVKKVTGLTITKIGNVVTPLEHGADGRFRISFFVTITLHEIVEVRNWPPTAAATVRIGQDAPEPPPATFPRSEIREQDAVKTVTVVAEAEIAGGRYVAFTYKSATLGDQETPEIKQMVDNIIFGE